MTSKFWHSTSLVLLSIVAHLIGSLRASAQDAPDIKSFIVRVDDAVLSDLRERLSKTRWIHSNHSYKSGGALDAHFGLGKSTKADLKVTLLDGREQVFHAVAANKSHQLQFGAK